MTAEDFCPVCGMSMMATFHPKHPQTASLVDLLTEYANGGVLSRNVAAKAASTIIRLEQEREELRENYRNTMAAAANGLAEARSRIEVLEEVVEAAQHPWDTSAMDAALSHLHGEQG